MDAKQWEIRVVGAWQVVVRPLAADQGGGPAGQERRLTITPPPMVTVECERYEALPVYDPAAAGWRRGQRLFRVASQETSVKGGLEPGSVSVHACASDGEALVRGLDYELDEDWSVVGRLETGGIGPEQPVFISYRYGLSRLDSVVLGAGGDLFIREGEPHVCVPRPPVPGVGERVLANLWLPGRMAGLGPEHVFPVQERGCPAPPPMSEEMVSGFLPSTWRRLREGLPLHILAWGDSVTDAGYLPGGSADRWQEQFVARLRRAFPRSAIRLTTVAWGGRCSRNFVDEPDDSPHSYKNAVLGAEPDLVVSEFVNDAYLKDTSLSEQYGVYLADFRRIGAEWIIQTPHYVRPDWMGLESERDVDEDPRPYVKAVRDFGAANRVPVTDASNRWGRLWRQGLPYTTLLLNAINHPDERGMAIFADALMAWFPAHGVNP